MPDPDVVKISTMSSMDIQKKIKGLFQLKRDLYANISQCKQTIKIADNCIDICEVELRKRGHL